MNKTCARCEKTVYPTEELKCLDKVWHKGCFKCQECGMTLNMKTYKGYGKLPYCESHVPKAKHTTMAETPELKRIAENTKIQSNVKYHADFEKSKGKFTQVADDPETLRIKANTKIISNVAYHGDLEKKAQMEKQRQINENGELVELPSDNYHQQIENYVTEMLSPNVPPPNLPPKNHYQTPYQQQTQLQPQTTQYQPHTTQYQPPTQYQQPAQYTQQTQYAQNTQYQQKNTQQHIQSAHTVPTSQHVQNSQQHVQNSHQHIQNSQPHVQNSQQHVQNSQQHVQNSQQHVQNSQQHVQNSQQHVQTSQQHVQSSQHVPNTQHHVQNTQHSNTQQHVQASQHLPQTAYQGQNSQYPTQNYQNRYAQEQLKKYDDYQYQYEYQNQNQYQGQNYQGNYQYGGQQKIGRIQDYDPVSDGPRAPPNTQRSSATLIYNSTSDGKRGSQQPQQQASRQIGRVTDLDPLADQTPAKPTANHSQNVYIAMYDYEATDSDEVSFREGDYISNVTSIDEGWMTGQILRTGRTGMLPANYVERVANN